MIRLATIEDLEKIVSFSKNFSEASNYSKFISEDKIREVASSLLTKKANEAIILLAQTEEHPDEDVGMLAGTVTPFVFGDFKMATELGWWVDPLARKSGIGSELINTFEYWAKKVGCNLVSMVSLDDSLHNYYTKHGYTLYERAYLKEL